MRSLDPGDSESRLDLPADVTGALTAACRRERDSEVAKRLAALDDKDREIIVLRAIEQNTNPAAARLLGLTESAVAARYRRALDRLRRKLPGSVFDDV
jgi:RNA polymerase sigma factor (sigma-70 family)